MTAHEVEQEIFSAAQRVNAEPDRGYRAALIGELQDAWSARLDQIAAWAATGGTTTPPMDPMPSADQIGRIMATLSRWQWGIARSCRADIVRCAR